MPRATGHGSHSSACAGVCYAPFYCAEPPFFPACSSPGAEGSSVVCFLCSDTAHCLLPTTLLFARHHPQAKNSCSLLLAALGRTSHQVSAWRAPGLVALWSLRDGRCFFLKAIFSIVPEVSSWGCLALTPLLRTRYPVGLSSQGALGALGSGSAVTEVPSAPSL